MSINTNIEKMETIIKKIEEIEKEHRSSDKVTLVELLIECGLIALSELFSEKSQTIKLSYDGCEYTIGISLYNGYIEKNGKVFGDLYVGISKGFVNSGNMVLNKVVL